MSDHRHLRELAFSWFSATPFGHRLAGVVFCGVRFLLSNRFFRQGSDDCPLWLWDWSRQVCAWSWSSFEGQIETQLRHSQNCVFCLIAMWEG
jgi:hypothetical protein